jgi:hypothetical protein
VQKGCIKRLDMEDVNGNGNGDDIEEPFREDWLDQNNKDGLHVKRIGSNIAEM